MQINVKLDKNFTTAFNRLCEKYSDRMRKLNGFADSQLNFTDFIDNFVDKQTVADATIDGNANVSHKDVVSLRSEMDKPHMKLLAFNKIYYELNKKYGYSVANEWLENEWNGSMYLHDAVSSTTVPYCFAYDIENLALKGLYFIDGFNAQPPKHLVTFTDFVVEFVSWVSNRSSGACGLPSFLIYSFYFWKKDVENGYYINSPEYYRDQEFQRVVYKLNQPYVRVNQSAFTNFSIFDPSYLVELFGGKEFPDGSYIIDYIDEIVEYQKAFMKVVSDVREQNAMTFPVLTMCLLKKDGKWAHEDFARWCCRHNMRWADSNFYVSSSVTALSNCCRLVSDVQELGYFNSIGGTSLEVGSVKVNTVNLARIAYENDRESYLDAIGQRVRLCLQALDVVRGIISRNIEKGLLPNYTLGIMHMENQYNTIGIIGIYEVLKKYGMVETDELGYSRYTDEGLEFAKAILAKIHEVKNEFGKDKDYKINIEQVPAERAASVLMEKDKELFPAEDYALPLYGNQWIPLAVKTTMQEKTRISAALDKACSGGSIAHINISAPFANFDQAWEMLNYVADAGVVYFAFCVRISVCRHNHSFYGNVCPVCGEPKFTSVQRVVGFLVPESAYSSERKAEFRMRDWMDVLSDVN